MSVGCRDAELYGKQDIVAISQNSPLNDACSSGWMDNRVGGWTEGWVIGCGGEQVDGWINNGLNQISFHGS